MSGILAEETQFGQQTEVRFKFEFNRSLSSRYDDAETSEQRSERIIIQSFAAVGELSMNCPGMTEEILNTINNVYDSTMEMGLNVRNAMLLCILQLIKNGQDVFNKNQYVL